VRSWRSPAARARSRKYQLSAAVRTAMFMGAPSVAE
jgi:hypothetical protein